MFKPMLAATLDRPELLRFPLLASQKLDGIRALTQGGMFVSRKLKPIPNRNVQRLFITLPENLDGELIVGDPCAPDAYRKTMSLVMSNDKPLDYFKEPLRFHVFDYYSQSLGFSDRLLIAQNLHHKSMQYVEHVTLHSMTELEAYEEEMLEMGAEGIMLRKPDGPYKQNRSTEIEGWLVKVKRFRDSDAVVTGYFEEQENTNTAQVNELGRTKRSHMKSGMVNKGTLGGFIVVDTKSGVEFRVGGGFTAEQRREYWTKREKLKGKVLKYKYFPSGSKDRPRHPVFLDWRHEDD